MSYLFSQPSTQDEPARESAMYLEIDEYVECDECREAITDYVPDDIDRIGGDESYEVEWIAYDVKCKACGYVGTYGNMEV